MLSRKKDLWHLEPKPLSPFSLGWLDCTRPPRVPRLAKQKPVLWGAPFEKLGCWIHKPMPSLSWEKLGAMGSLPNYMALCWGQGRWWEGVLNLPIGLGEPGFALTQGTRAFHLISGFLTKWICSWTVAELVCLFAGEEGSRASYFAILLISLLKNFNV